MNNVYFLDKPRECTIHLPECSASTEEQVLTCSQSWRLWLSATAPLVKIRSQCPMAIVRLLYGHVTFVQNCACTVQEASLFAVGHFAAQQEGSPFLKVFPELCRLAHIWISLLFCESRNRCARLNGQCARQCATFLKVQRSWCQSLGVYSFA